MARITNLAFLGTLLSLNFVLAGCADPAEESEALGTNTNHVDTPDVPDGVEDCTFIATLTGDQEVPSVTTEASGTAVFRLNRTRDEFDFELNLTKIENITAAHIHLAPRGVNGDVVALLFAISPPVTFFRVLGTFDASRLSGPLEGEPLSALIREMKNGNTYTNVHTTAHPNGEIRGQIELVSECDLKEPCDDAGGPTTDDSSE